MFAIIRRSPIAFFIALLLHVAVVAFLVIGVDWRKQPKPVASDARVVQAQLVDSSKLDREVDRLKRTEEQKQQQVLEARRKEEARLAELKKRRAEEKQRLARLETERKAREQAEVEAKRKAEVEKKRLAEIERKQREIEKKQQAEKKRLAALEAKRKAEEKARVEAERKRRQAEKEKAEAEKRRKEEQARRKREAAEQRKREAAARAKAEAEARERELQAQFEAEQRASEAARLVRLIQDKVARKWSPPSGTLDQGLRCKINVRLGASGSVLAVSIVESSGHGGFDRSVEAAVWKADPLPMPDDTALRSLDTFRNHTFTFDPSKSL